MRVNIRGTVLDATNIGGTGYADLEAVTNALGLAELVCRLSGITVVQGDDGRPLVRLRQLTERANLPHVYDAERDTFHIDSLPRPPEVPAEPVGAGVDPWLPVTPIIAGGPGERRPDLLERILKQFHVDRNPRHAPRDGNTYCNIYVWDATRALGAEIPHWVDHTGHPAAVGNGLELDANNTILWLRKAGPNYGWRPVINGERAANLANLGFPVVASWYNPGGIGHVAMVRPGHAHASRGIPIAQAGATNFDDGYLLDGFGQVGPIEYWTHD